MNTHLLKVTDFDILFVLVYFVGEGMHFLLLTLGFTLEQSLLASVKFFEQFGT